jgi:hypothetical protein
MSEAPALEAPPRVRKREHYIGPGTGRAWLCIGEGEIPVRVMLSASEPGEGADIGDVFLILEGTGEGERGRLRVRLDIGAKRFLHGLLEQALTIGDFARGV